MSRAFLFSLCFLWLFSCSQVQAYTYNVSVCAIFQNEERFLKEWIEYHKMQGVEHFYLYNNNSQDNSLTVLFPYIGSGEVEVIDWPDLWPDIQFPFGCQAKAYNHCLKKCKNETRWLALIDTDEFIVTKDFKSIKKVLNENYNASAVHAWWRCYGTSNVPKIQRLMLRELTRCARADHPHNKFYKSIVRPELVKTCRNPHFCDMLSNAPSKDASEHMWINHYWTRDEEFFTTEKIARYEKWGADIDGVLQLAEDMNEEEFNYMLLITDKLEKRIYGPKG